jgi:MFS family permease
VLAPPDIQADLHLSNSSVGLLGFAVFAAEFVIALFIGYGMDRKSRRWMWMFCLAMAAILTRLTVFVQNFAELVMVRALASGFAQAELAVSVTLVNEQVPAGHRGLLYSIVQSGWPLGVFLASGVYLLSSSGGWRQVFLWGVVPLVVVVIGRFKIREMDRFLQLKAVRQADAAGDTERVRELLEQRPINVEDWRRAASEGCSPPPARSGRT